MFAPRVHRPGYLQLARHQDNVVLLKILTINKSSKWWLPYLLRQEFHHNQDNNDEGEHVDETSCVRNARND